MGDVFLVEDEYVSDVLCALHARIRALGAIAILERDQFFESEISLRVKLQRLGDCALSDAVRPVLNVERRPSKGNLSQVDAVAIPNSDLEVDG